MIATSGARGKESRLAVPASRPVYGMLGESRPWPACVPRCRNDPGSKMTSRRSITGIAVVYGLLSVLLWLVGWRWGSQLLDDLTALGYAVLVLVLGPLAFALNLGAGIPGPGLTVLWVLCYVATCIALAVCLRLARGTSPLVRATGIAVFILVWLAAAAMNILGLLRGL
jgi:hypothetical protein